jgi:hypothetical protein
MFSFAFGPITLFPIIQSARNGTDYYGDKNSLAVCIIAPLAQKAIAFHRYTRPNSTK